MDLFIFNCCHADANWRALHSSGSYLVSQNRICTINKECILCINLTDERYIAKNYRLYMSAVCIKSRNE